MGDSKNKAPPPPDYGPLIAASKEASDKAFTLGREQLAWAKERYAEDKTITDRTVTSFLDAMDFGKANAEKDRARYEGTFQPLENKLVADAESYASPERRNQEMGRAEADVGQQFDAARANAERQLEGYGINPSATRYAALDIGIRTQEAAAKAAASDAAARHVDDTGRQLRAQAIDIGRGYPGQSIASSGLSTSQGGAAAAGQLATTASGAQTMGTSPQYMGIGTQALGNWGNVMNTQYQNQLAQYEANQKSSSGIGGILGAVAGVGMRLAGFSKGGAVPANVSPSRGASVDDVPAALSVGEFVVPREAVAWLGEKHMRGLVEKAKTERAEAVPTAPSPVQLAMDLSRSRRSTNIEDRRGMNESGMVSVVPRRSAPPGNTAGKANPYRDGIGVPSKYPFPYDENGNPIPAQAVPMR